MSGEVISIEDFRKSAALLGKETTDRDQHRARHLLNKHLLRVLSEARAKDLSMNLISMALFSEAVSALSANDWEPDEMVLGIREMEAEDFFNNDDEEEDDDE